MHACCPGFDKGISKWHSESDGVVGRVVRIAEGAFVSIVGPSGSGKTTLLGLLAGLDTPSRGSVTLDGVDLGSLDEDRRARLRGAKVGFVFQSFQLIPTLTALENVQVPLELTGAIPIKEASERARDLLGRVGLGDRTHHFPHSFPAASSSESRSHAHL